MCSLVALLLILLFRRRQAFGEGIALSHRNWNAGELGKAMEDINEWL